MLPNHTRKAVERYVNAINEVLNRWPDSTTFRPASPTTFAPRLRDALNAQVRYGYDLLTPEKQEKLTRLRPSIIVAIRDKHVLVGDKSSVRQNVVSSAESSKTEIVEAPFSPTALKIGAIDDERVLTALACLHHHNILQETELSLTDAQRKILENLTNEWDISLVDTNSKTIIL